jgi:hypothetical protein
MSQSRAGFVLAGQRLPAAISRHGDVVVIHCAGEEKRKGDAGFAGDFRDFDLKAVGDGLRAGVTVYNRLIVES